MKELKKKLEKVKKIKFIRNILVGVISLIVVALIINIAPGYKRDKYKNVVNLILNEENKTEELKQEIYIDENENVYISEEDIKKLFDTTIYYDEKYNQIVTTTNTKVVNLSIDEGKMIINDSIQPMENKVIKVNNNIYLPIEDMEVVYNIEVEYIKTSNKVVIDNLSKGMIKAIVKEKSDIKFKPRGLSKNIGTIDKGESVYCFYTTGKGWRQIRTSDGTLRICKS